MIAYNMCFSTCLGRLNPQGVHSSSSLYLWAWRWLATLTLGMHCLVPQEGLNRRLGFMEYEPDPGELPRMAAARGGEPPFVSPNGVIFAPASERQGVLPAMLSEILQTRYVVGGTMLCYIA